MADQIETIAPADLFITDQLKRRPVRKADYLQEKLALQALARQMVSDPDDVLARLVSLAMEATQATSAGISLLEEDVSPPVFRWHHLHGQLAEFSGATTPRHFSPCGVTLDRREATLTQHPERFYSWIADANIVCPEVLLVPLYANDGDPLGTLWVVSEREQYFDSGHARVLMELAAFAGIAIHMIQAEKRLRAALERQEWLTREQEMLTKEMGHRVKNLFSVVMGMVHFSARSSETPAEMAESLSGRLLALANANALVRRTFNSAAMMEGTLLGEVLQTLLLPHTADGIDAGDHRFKSSGPEVFLGEHATNCFALVCHELATNAAKYGALANENGYVDVSWRIADETLKLVWRERGGPLVTSAPAKAGFGSKLSRSTIEGQFKGSLSYDWQPGGLVVTLSVPLEKLSR